MKNVFVRLRAAALCAIILIGISGAAQAACVVKSGEGAGGSEEAAALQAWEAVLQVADWGAWAQWMKENQKPGSAPGYDVSDYKLRCKPGGGLGYTCTAQAKLCEK